MAFNYHLASQRGLWEVKQSTHWYCLLLCPCPMLGPRHSAPGLEPPNWLPDPSVCQETCPLLFKCSFAFIFFQMLLGSSYPFARKSSMKTHFTPDPGQSPLYDIQYFSQSDPKPLLKTNPQQASKTLLLLCPGGKFSFPMCILLAALPVSASFSGWADFPPGSHSFWGGDLELKPAIRSPTIYYL